MFPSTTRYGMYTPMTLSGTNSFLKRPRAKVRRLPTNSLIRSIAWSRVSWNGRIASGTAPLGIWVLTDRVWRHQWQRACSSSSTRITTSAPQPSHFRDITVTSSLLPAAPAAACLQFRLRPDHPLRPAALARRGHPRDGLADVGGARGQGVAAQPGDRGVQPEGLLGGLLVPLTATVPADQRPAPDRVVDIGAATAGALVQPVAAARAGVDDAVSAVLLCGGLTGAAGSAG